MSYNDVKKTQAWRPPNEFEEDPADILPSVGVETKQDGEEGITESKEPGDASLEDQEAFFLSGIPLLLLVAGLVLGVFVFGKLYSTFNIKWVYLIAMVIFEIGSIIGALATSSPMLIAGRAISGIGASAIFSGGATIIGFSVPLKSRAIYLGILASMFGLASVIGPLLGGVFTDRASWRWCFWINLPLGGIAMLVVLLFFKPPKRKVSQLTVLQKLSQFDYVGALLLICAITCLLLSLQWGGIVYPWSHSKVYGCIIGFTLIIICFVAVELKLGDKAAVPLRMFRNRTVWSASLVSGFLIMAMYDHVYYLPFYFQVVKGVSAEESGVRSIPYFLSLALSSTVGGFVISAIGTYVEFAWIGTALLTIGSGLIYTLKVDSSAGIWIGFQIVAGFGVGLAIQTPFIAVQTAVEPGDIPLGMAIAIFFNSLGGALSISIAQNIFVQGLRDNIPRYTTGVNVDSIIGAGATDVGRNVQSDQRDGLLYAYNIAITNAFIFAVGAAGMAFLMSLLVSV
ncbi:MAG: hypothetical protein M1830_010023 [Pleopsidium flavum]|nr:MAG: hypothetical protein M1830_010023 [Pleopsidium flavum]